MLKQLKSLSTKTLWALAAAVAFSAGGASVGAQTIQEELDPNNPFEQTFNAVFYRGASATKIGDVLAHASFQGGDLTVTMTQPDTYAWSYANVCVFSSPAPLGSGSQTGNVSTGMVWCSGWGLGNVNLASKIYAKN